MIIIMSKDYELIYPSLPLSIMAYQAPAIGPPAFDPQTEGVA